MDINITILTNDPRWKGLGPTVKRGVEAALLTLPPSVRGGQGGGKKRNSDTVFIHTTPTPTLPLTGGGIITILLTNDAEVKSLNAQYRGKNKPTNVLSFPDGSEERDARGRTVRQLGDIAMAYETIAAEAAAQGKALKHHISHLAIHGTLHLLGYDHEQEAEAEAMEALEIAILARMGIANPYESE
jgi:probable rRNA maturation factor